MLSLSVTDSEPERRVALPERVCQMAADLAQERADKLDEGEEDDQDMQTGDSEGESDQEMQKAEENERKSDDEESAGERKGAGNFVASEETYEIARREIPEVSVSLRVEINLTLPRRHSHIPYLTRSFVAPSRAPSSVTFRLDP